MLPFSAMAQAFLLQEQWWNGAMTGVRGVSRHHEDVAAFTTRQWLDMWSPSNFPMSNPQVLKETLTTGGANLANGFANWSRDAMAVLTEGKPRGVEAFLPGTGVALTPGKVVFRNRLIELIQYEPATAKVDAEPVLIVPSWIMKYYILDLTPADSLVRYLVDQGHSVFMVSWKNPDSQDRDLGLDDYLELGAMAALKAVGELRPGAGIHAAGYCLGGTLLAMAAAALGARPRNPLKTVSLLAAQVDFHEPGELGLFIDESHIGIGQLNGNFDLTGKGNSVRQMLASSSGKVELVVAGGKISKLMMEKAGLHLWEILELKMAGDRLVKLRCAVAGFDVKQGNMQVNAMIFDTEVTTIIGTGSIDLGDEKLDLTLNQKTKYTSPLALRSPIYVRGSFARPAVEVDKGRVAARALGAIALGLVNPLLTLIPLIDAGPGKDSDCGELVREARALPRAPIRGFRRLWAVRS